MTVQFSQYNPYNYCTYNYIKLKYPTSEYIYIYMEYTGIATMDIYIGCPGSVHDARIVQILIICKGRRHPSPRLKENNN